MGAGTRVRNFSLYFGVRKTKKRHQLSPLPGDPAGEDNQEGQRGGAESEPGRTVFLHHLENRGRRGGRDRKGEAASHFVGATITKILTQRKKELNRLRKRKT